MYITRATITNILILMQFSFSKMDFQLCKTWILIDNVVSNSKLLWTNTSDSWPWKESASENSLKCGHFLAKEVFTFRILTLWSWACGKNLRWLHSVEIYARGWDDLDLYKSHQVLRPGGPVQIKCMCQHILIIERGTLEQHPKWPLVLFKLTIFANFTG